MNALRRSYIVVMLLTCLSASAFATTPPAFGATPFENETVDEPGNTGRFTSLALDEAGNPRITYLDDSLGYPLMYAAKNDGVWSFDQIDQFGTYNSLVLDTQQVPHVSYFNQADGDLKYAVKNGVGWILETVDALGTVTGVHNSLALDAAGIPHIAYLSDGSLKYAVRNGGIWSTEFVLVGNVQAVSIAVDSAGDPHICYRETSTSDLSYAYKTGGIWTYETPDPGSFPTLASIAIDAQDIPRIAYGTSSVGLKYATRESGTWEVETVAAGGTDYVSLKLDAQGAPHVGFHDTSDGTLKYAVRNSGIWTLETVDTPISMGDVGQYVSLALDDLAHPHLSYYDADHEDLKYADSYVTLSSPVGGERWQAGSQQTVRWIGLGAVRIGLSPDGGASYQTILPSATGESAVINVPDWATSSARVRLTLLAEPTFVSDSPGMFSIAPALASPWWLTTPDPTPGGGITPSLALDHLGNPGIAHTAGTGLLYVERQGGSWSSSVADNTTDCGYFSSLAFDSNGDPHVSHSVYPAGGLRYSSRSGGSWTNELVDGAPASGFLSSLALGTNDDPYISYYDADLLQLKIAHKNGGWTITTVDNSGTVGAEKTSLALDSRDRPRIAYYDQAPALKFAADDGTGTYSIETVDDVGDPGHYASLAIDEDDAPHIAYYEQNNGNVRYAEKRDGAWHTETVDADGNVGYDISLALDENGDPVISYYGGTLGRMKVARRIGGTWRKEAVSNHLAGYYTSVALDAEGNARVAYQDYGNGVLRYASSAIELASPSPGDVWPVGATRTVRWDGTGRVNISLSTDGGNTFQTLAENVSGGSYGIVVPHRPSAFAQIRVERAVPRSQSTTPGLFTVQTDIMLLSLSAVPAPTELGAVISWETDPGPGDLEGYRLEKRASGGAWSPLVSLTTDTEYRDVSARPGTEYRLFGVNRFGESLLLGRATFGTLRPLAAGPLPYRGGKMQIRFSTGGGLGGGPGTAEVALFDLQGRLVRTLASGPYAAGVQTVEWDGRDDGGRPVGSGVYFLRSASAGERHSLKFVVVR